MSGERYKKILLHGMKFSLNYSVLENKLESTYSNYAMHIAAREKGSLRQQIVGFNF